jgi:RNA polymerase sigma factor (sigma-70 family)
MSPSPEFQDLMSRAEQGDPQAVAEVMARFGPEVRLAARTRLTPRVRRQVDSEDIQQSVFVRFFRRLWRRDDPLHFEGPSELRAYLARTVRNRVVTHYRKTRRQGAGQQVDLGDGLEAIPAAEPAAESGWEAVLEQMTPAERQIAEWRAEGRTWDEIAELLNGHRSTIYQGFMRRVRAALSGWRAEKER